MYNLHEIKLQNMQDAFSMLYLSLADKLTGEFGKTEGERILREAVRRAGRDSGEEILNKHRQLGIRTNLKNLMKADCTLLDPRFAGKHVVDEEERQIFEVYTCPLAHFWNWRGGSDAGSCFCEEFQRAKVLAYTAGKGQLNLSNRLTSIRDGFCLLAAFYREANIDCEAAAASFSKCGGKEEAKPEIPGASFRENIGRLTADLYTRIYETAGESKGEEGRLAVKKGLAAFAAEEKAFLIKKAEDTGKCMDAEFVRANFQLDADPAGDEAWDGILNPEAVALMKETVLDLFFTAQYPSRQERGGIPESDPKEENKN